MKVTGENLTTEQCVAIAKGALVEIDENALLRVRSAHATVAEIATGEKAVYGVNTGFGYFANQRVSPEELQELQVNILRSHASGWGEPLTQEESRLAMALRLNVLLRGNTGVSVELCKQLQEYLNRGIISHIPRLGSVGASGDLAPLAHLALPLIGEGRVWYKGELTSADKALQKEGLTPYKLQAKEGLGLINGTQVMLAVGTLAVGEAFKLLQMANRCCALSLEGMNSSLTPFDSRIHEARGHFGQRECALEIDRFLAGSYLKEDGRTPLRLQDPYSLRCAPQVHGASFDALRHCQSVISTELNASTDNPLVFGEEIVSGGNFHGQPLALVFDFAAMAVAELTNISDRRIEVLMNSHLSNLPAFLTPKEGVRSGYMAAQYLTASIVNRGKVLAHPTSTDSIPGNVGIEDHVSMGTNGAHKLAEIVHNAWAVFAVEALSAAQAIDLRGVGPLGEGTEELYKMIRKNVPTLDGDRIIADEIELITELIKEV